MKRNYPQRLRSPLLSPTLSPSLVEMKGRRCPSSAPLISSVHKENRCRLGSTVPTSFSSSQNQSKSRKPSIYEEVKPGYKLYLRCRTVVIVTYQTQVSRRNCLVRKVTSVK